MIRRGPKKRLFCFHQVRAMFSLRPHLQGCHIFKGGEAPPVLASPHGRTLPQGISKSPCRTGRAGAAVAKVPEHYQLSDPATARLSGDASTAFDALSST